MRFFFAVVVASKVIKIMIAKFRIGNLIKKNLKIIEVNII